MKRRRLHTPGRRERTLDIIKTTGLRELVVVVKTRVEGLVGLAEGAGLRRRVCGVEERC